MIVIVLAAFALGQALQVSNGALSIAGIVWLSVAMVLVAFGLVRPSLFRLTETRLSLLVFALVVFQLVQLGLAPPAMYIEPYASFSGFRGGLALIAGLLVGAKMFGPLRLPAMLFLFLVLGRWLIQASPHPYIDVDIFQRDALSMLLKGFNPYALRPPSIYPEASGFNAPGLVVDGRLQYGYPYPPLSLLLALPGHVLFGDYRYSQLLAMVGAGAFIGYARPGKANFEAAALLLFSPRTFFVLEQGWTEPFVLLLATGAVFAATRAPRLGVLVMGALFTVKQYAPLCFPLLAAGRGPEGRRDMLLLAAPLALVGVAAGVDPHNFWISVVASHLVQPFRADALSFPALLGAPWLAYAGWVLPAAPAWFARHQRATASTALLMCAAMLLCFFSFGRQCGANYYWLVIGLLTMAAATDEGAR
jgi:hypothetical protein